MRNFACPGTKRLRWPLATILRARSYGCVVLSAGLGLLGTSLSSAQDASFPQASGTPPFVESEAGHVRLGSPSAEPDRSTLPINLPSALQLVSSRPIDVQLAQERIRAAAAVLDQAQFLWLPTVTIGGDYNRHDGETQDATGNVITNSHSALMFGLGSGIGSAAVLSINDAIFAPLAARQTLAARRADAQAATNDSMVAVTDAYFNVEQARGDLAGSVDATRRTEEVVRRVKKLAAGIVAPLEVVRTEAELARRQDAELTSRERWQVSGAELARLLRLDASAQIEPVEPPHLQITLIAAERTIDDLIGVGLTNRPELASNQAQVQATLALLRQEQMRPFVPSVLLRGDSTPVTGTLGAGVFAGGTNGSIGSTGFRSDFDLQLLWQLDNLGFGNAAKARQRESEHRTAILELFRTQDRIAAEVTKAYSQTRQATRRVKIGEQQVKLSLESYDKNLIGLAQTRRVGDVIQTIVRPQEMIAAVQSLAQAYSDYYLAVADYNRAQFRLYRALGQPAQLVAERAEDPEPVRVPPAPSAKDETPGSVSIGDADSRDPHR